MSGKWCTWCDQSPSEWKKNDPTDGELWTLDKMKELRCLIADGLVEKNASNRKGCVDVPLII